jgi:hypothetical protein
MKLGCGPGLLKSRVLHMGIALSFRPAGGIPSLRNLPNYGIPRRIPRRLYVSVAIGIIGRPSSFAWCSWITGRSTLKFHRWLKDPWARLSATRDKRRLSMVLHSRRFLPAPSIFYVHLLHRWPCLFGRFNYRKRWRSEELEPNHFRYHDTVGVSIPVSMPAHSGA